MWNDDDDTSTSPTELLWIARVAAIGLIVGMLLITCVAVIDGPKHKLGTIQMSDEHFTSQTIKV